MGDDVTPNRSIELASKSYRWATLGSATFKFYRPVHKVTQDLALR